MAERLTPHEYLTAGALDVAGTSLTTRPHGPHTTKHVMAFAIGVPQPDRSVPMAKVDITTQTFDHPAGDRLERAYVIAMAASAAAEEALENMGEKTSSVGGGGASYQSPKHSLPLYQAEVTLEWSRHKGNSRK